MNQGAEMRKGTKRIYLILYLSIVSLIPAHSIHLKAKGGTYNTG